MKPILKKQLMGFLPNGRPRIDLSLPERKNVRFEVRVKIHEFEKYLDNMDDYQENEDSSDNDNNQSDYDQNNQDNQMMRKNSIGVT